MPLIYLSVFLLSTLLSYGITPALIRIAHIWNLLDIPTDRKCHREPTPYIGGIAVFISFWTVIFSALFFFYIYGSQIRDSLPLPSFFYNLQAWSPKILGVFIGGVLMLVIGILDDRFDLSPIVKFIGQSGAAVILLKIGLQVNLFQDFGLFGYFITYGWIIMLMNAFNFIDSIDGHCAGIALISTFIFFLLTQIVHQTAVALLIATFAGSLLGFLPYNFKPARTFLGDNGSLFIGYILSVITLLCRYNNMGNADNEVTPLIPILMFGIPLYDTVSVITVRILRGIPPWAGDRNHFAHRLVRLGMGDRTAVLASYFMAITLGLVALISTQIKTDLGSFLLLLLFGCIISIIALLEFYAALRIRLAEQLATQKKRRRDDIRQAEDRL